ncbi:glycoside hydrolase family 13 protein, partial [bacterium]|nr:glycoside hydrolase family 13 protein [bacterium]
VFLRFRTCANDVDKVLLVATSKRSESTQRAFVMKPSAFFNGQRSSSGFSYWEYALPIQAKSDILTYYFEIRDGDKVVYYTDDDLVRAPGGLGHPVEAANDPKTFQITVYDSHFEAPEWSKGAVVYQIFPDRFRNGNRSNDPANGTGFIYGKKIVKRAWHQPFCDRDRQGCRARGFTTFYGGDLRGVREKLLNIQALGVSVIYLNPIFESPTNHRYDVSNYWKIDPSLGTEEDLKQLLADAKKLGIRVITDGIFSHVSADSPYFDLYGRWNEKLGLTSPSGVGRNDGSGACESSNSKWRSWFYFPDFGSPAKTWDLKAQVLCPGSEVNPTHAAQTTYDAWYGFFNHPRLNTQNTGVRSLFFSEGLKSVIPYWTSLGISGWRLDAVDQIDPGELSSPGNGFWRELRAAVKKIAPDSWIVGEWWENPSVWLLGKEWDSATNYLLRSALLDWMFDACRGNGCQNAQFSDNDSNPKSKSGTIQASTESAFLNRLKGIQEVYPEPVWKSAMNLLGSHDTNRILFLLKKISSKEDAGIARKKLKMLVAFMMTYPGAPTIYYGDEVGLASEGIWENNTWEDDPYNRAPYPWADQGLKSDQDLLQYHKTLGQLRAKEDVLRLGEFNVWGHDDQKRWIAYSRDLSGKQILIVMNRGASTQEIALSSQFTPVEKTEFEEVYPNPARVYRVKKGVLSIQGVEGLSVRILKRRVKTL